MAGAQGANASIRIRATESIPRIVTQSTTHPLMTKQIAPSLLAVVLTAVGFTFATAALAASPPETDQVLWLKADAGLVTEQPEAVSEWIDQAPGSSHSGTAVGNPSLAQASFPNGSHPVIRFNGASGFDLDNDAELELPSLSVFAVASVDNSVAAEIFIGHFKPTFGWALGVSDSTPGRVKWFTAPPQSLEPAAGSLGNHVPTQLTGTFGDGNKELFVNGTLADSLGGLSLDYGGGGGALTVGYLGSTVSICRATSRSSWFSIRRTRSSARKSRRISTPSIFNPILRPTTPRQPTAWCCGCGRMPA